MSHPQAKVTDFFVRKNSSGSKPNTKNCLAIPPNSNAGQYVANTNKRKSTVLTPLVDSEINARSDFTKHGVEVRAIARKSASESQIQVKSLLNPAWWKRTKAAPWESEMVDAGEHSVLAEFLQKPSQKRKLTTSHLQTTSTNIQLTTEQCNILNTVLAGTSIFFTGAAGTGKSYLLFTIIDSLRRRLRYDQVAVTATTGLAALNIGGSTIHRWGGLGLAKDSVSVIAAKISKRQDLRSRWQNVKVLIIDEVSMLDGDLFDKLEEIARLVRKSSKPFGGIQLVITGDFFQLPPVSKGQVPQLCFQATSWNRSIQKMSLLTQIFRQTDERLVNLLNALRRGNITKDVVEQFRMLERQVAYPDGLEPTQLYPLRRQVDEANKSRMSAIEGREFIYMSEDSGLFDNESTQRLLADVMMPSRLALKAGAQVILLVNLSAQLVNGSRGRVETFVNDEVWPILQNLATRWPEIISLYNTVLNDNGQISSKTQAWFSSMDHHDREDLVKVLSREDRLPVVRFRDQLVLVERTDQKVEGPPPGRPILATRVQIPLLPSWAMSIHKAQGQTVDRLVVDLSNTFEKGQAYVAVSRARCFDRLQVKGFSTQAVKVDSRVLQFYEKLESSTKGDAK